MATTTFINKPYKNVGTGVATVWTVPAATQATVVGLCCANTTNTAVTVSIYLTQSSVNYYIVNNATVPAGGSLVAVGGDQKLVLQASDQINVTASTSSCIDVIMSLLQVT